MKSSSTLALEPETLYAKSQVYIRRGFRAKADKDTEEYQLWASLSLELLGKAALAKVHPALVADPTHYQSLFAACGRQLSPDTKTITAKTLFERLSHLDKAFDSRHQMFCNQMAIRRNAELHSGESPFSGMSPEAWEREFWGAVQIVLSMQDETLESWLGTEDSEAPARIIEQANKALDWAVRHRVSRCTADFEEKYRDPAQRRAIVERSKTLRWADSSWDAIERAECPACHSCGFLGGELWCEEITERDLGPSEYGPEGEDLYIPPRELVEKTYITEGFKCLVCNLELFGRREIEQTSIQKEFLKFDYREMEFVAEYGND
jgi:hypothetical protein